MADPNVKPSLAGRTRSGRTGRVYGGESAPRRDALGFLHHDSVRSDGDQGRANRIYGQAKPKMKLPRPPKGGLSKQRVR
jgi:hypothetical protein